MLTTALFVAVRKEIENDSEKILEVHKMQYLYLVGWFLEAERRRRDIDPRLQENDFGLVGGSLNQHTFVVVMKLMREGFEKGESQNFDVVYASMVCFKQILLTVKAMESSRSYEDKDIASNMKSRLFYEDASLNLLAQLPRNAANRSLAFIRESIELTHVVLKMLEAYSKEHTALFVKTKRRQRKAKKAIEPAEAHDSSENEENEQEESRRVTTERKFEFSRFEAKYITESTLDTYKTFLETYKELSSREIMWVLTFFHRTFVKREARGLFFSLDLISLLSRMTGHSSEGLPHSHPARKDVEQFMTYYTKKLLQSLERTPALFVELLFDKLPEHLFYFDHGYDKQPKQPRTQIEWEFVDGNQSTERQIATVVAALMDDDKQPAVTSIIEQLEQIREKRENWSLESGFASTHPPDEPITKVDTKDGKVRLLLQAMQFPLRPSGRFTVPALFPNERISEWLMYLKKYLSEPVEFESGGVAADQLRIKRTEADAGEDVEYADAASPGVNGAENASSDDDGGIDGFQDERFKSHLPPDELAALQESRLRDRAKRRPKKPTVKKAKSKRAARSEDKANEKALQRAQAEKEKLAKIKSSAFVNDSDDEDDAEKDEQFFAQELALRRQIEEAHANGVNTQDLFLARKAYKQSSVLDDNLFVTDNSDEEPAADDPTTDTDDDAGTRSTRKRSVGEDDDDHDSDLLHVTSPEPEPQSTGARSSKRQKNIVLDSDEE